MLPAIRPTTISNLLTPELVVPALSDTTKGNVLETLSAHVGLIRPQVDVPLLASALHDRERQSTTALEHGIAIPHARIAGLPTPLAAFGRSIPGIACGAPDGRPTHLFLLIVVAAERPGNHLKLLANAARLLGDAACRSRLLEAASAVELLAVLREHEERTLGRLRAA
jgi:mannitol/fructose-specific phosphotransferase system IIA component (Ntr-type)